MSRRASYTRKPVLAQLPTHNRVSRSVNICVTSRERSVNTGCKRLFGRYSICVIINVKRGTRCPSKICEEAEIHGEPRNLPALWKYFRLGIPYLRV